MQDDIEKAFNHWWEMNATLIDSKSEAASDAWLEATRQANEAHAARSGWVAIEDASERVYLTSVIGYLAGFAPTTVWQNPKNRSEWGKYDDNKNFIPALPQPSHILNLKPYPQLKGGE